MRSCHWNWDLEMELSKQWVGRKTSCTKKKRKEKKILKLLNQGRVVGLSETKEVQQSFSSVSGESYRWWGLWGRSFQKGLIDHSKYNTLSSAQVKTIWNFEKESSVIWYMFYCYPSGCCRKSIIVLLKGQEWKCNRICLN